MTSPFCRSKFGERYLRPQPWAMVAAVCLIGCGANSSPEVAPTPPRTHAKISSLKLRRTFVQSANAACREYRRARRRIPPIQPESSLAQTRVALTRDVAARGRMVVGVAKVASTCLRTGRFCELPKLGGGGDGR